MARLSFSFVRRAEFWLPVGLFVLALGGSHLLRQDRFVHLSDRDRTAYGLRPVWQARFDALSAAAGVGLLTYDLREDYTVAGRWVLAGLGLAGAALYLASARQVLARLWAQSARPLPRTGAVLAAFAVIQIVLIPVVWILEWLATGAAPGLADSAWRSISALASLGWLPDGPPARAGWIYAVVAFIGAIGFLSWFSLPGLKGRFGHGLPGRGLLVVLGSYVALLVLCGGLVSVLEAPRGTPHGPPIRAGLRGEPQWPRLGRSVVQVAAAAGAGLPIEAIADRGVSDSTKALLAGVELVGGLGGSPGGGITWLAVLWAVAGAVALLGRGRAAADPSARRCVLAGVALPAAVLGFALVVAFGLLVIENHTAAAFQSEPSFADALLEAASATGGGGLTSGLTAAITSANLSRGIRQSVDLYQYGMVWLIMAMFVGRVLPVLVLGRCAATRIEGEA